MKVHRAFCSRVVDIHDVLCIFTFLYSCVSLHCRLLEQNVSYICKDNGSMADIVSAPDDLCFSSRIGDVVFRTSDEYGIAIRNILYHNGIDHDRIKDCIIASVVPAVMHSLTSGIIKYFDTKPLIVAAGVKTGINIQTEVPSQIGADRIVDAAGAYELYGGPLIVIDFGTATTYDFVDEKGSFKYGVTAPGIRISAKALWLPS